MDPDGDKKNKISKRSRKKNHVAKGSSTNASAFLQSVWVRCRSIFINISDRKFMESELRFVLYSGAILWGIYLLFMVIK